LLDQSLDLPNAEYAPATSDDFLHHAFDGFLRLLSTLVNEVQPLEVLGLFPRFSDQEPHHCCLDVVIMGHFGMATPADHDLVDDVDFLP